MFIYQADCYCDLCGEQIRHELEVAGKMPANPEDETTYDSDDYPKGADDDSESDCPQHCGSHEDCLNAITLPSGRKIGALIGNNLTGEGIKYVKEEVVDGGEVADFWREQFDYIDFGDERECDDIRDYDS